MQLKQNEGTIMRSGIIRIVVLMFVFAGLSHQSSATSGWRFDRMPDYTDPAQFNLILSDPWDEGGNMATMSMSMPDVSLTGNVADVITPEIENLAASMEYDPARIFEFVYNGIEYEHYFGSKRGAHMTLLEGAGNDMDQAALLVALFRAAGHQAGYVSLWNVVSYNKGIPGYPDGIAWLGLDPAPLPGIYIDPEWIPDGWTELQLKQTLVLRDFCAYRGFDTYTFSNFPGEALIQRTLVMVNIDNTIYALDPSAKAKSVPERMDILAGTGFNKSSFLTAIGGVATNHYVRQINETVIQEQLSDHAENLLGAIRDNRPGDSVEELLGIGSVIPITHPVIDAEVTPMPWAVSESYPIEYFSSLSTSIMSRLEIQINATAVHSIPMPTLSGQRLAITHSGTTVRVWLEDAELFSRSITGSTYRVTLRAKHPHYFPSTSTPRNDGEFETVYKRNDDMAYALIYSFSTTRRLIRHRQEQLDGYIEAVRAIDEELVGENGDIDLENLADATLRRQITTELLNLMGLNWLYQSDFMNRICASVNEVSRIEHHTFGRMGQEEGFYVDVGLWRTGNFNRNGLDMNQRYLMVSSYLDSALEHGIIDQYAFQTNSAVSTVQILHLANSSGDSEKKPHLSGP